MPIEHPIRKSIGSVLADVALEDFGASRVPIREGGDVDNEVIDDQPLFSRVPFGFEEELAFDPFDQLRQIFSQIANNQPTSTSSPQVSHSPDPNQATFAPPESHLRR